MPKGQYERWKPIAIRLWEKVKINEESGCWEWQGSKNQAGYGQIQFDGRVQLAHRVVWKIIYGNIPNAVCVLHKCDNPLCINYFHLFIGSLRDNTQDMIKKGKARFTSNVAVGSKHGMAKLTEQDIVEIRRLLKTNIKQTLIAKQFSVTRSLISAIKCNKIWNHVI